MLVTLVTVSYPFILFFGLSYYEFRTILIFLVVPLLFRFLFLKKYRLMTVVVSLLVLLFVILIFLKDDIQYFMFTPVLINLGLLSIFGGSLFSARCFVERLALLQAKELSTEELLYCRQVNYLWCLIFLINASVAGYLAWSDNLVLWTLYNGLLGYLLVGTFYGLELVYRHWRFRHYTGSLSDPFFKKFFPPKDGGI